MDKLLELIQKDPQIAASMVEPLVAKYKIVADVIWVEMVKLYKDYAADEDLCNAVALKYHNLYLSFMSYGFTEDQAMSLLLTNIRKEATLIDSVSKSVASSANKKG